MPSPHPSPRRPLVVNVLLAACVLAAACATPVPRPHENTVPTPERLLTVAERSAWRATARHADVLELVDALAAEGPHLTRATLGTSVEGRELPLLIVADPPVASPADLERVELTGTDADYWAERKRRVLPRGHPDGTGLAPRGRLVVLVFGNIHAGEVCGKEALLMLARELALEPERPDNRALLEQLVIVFAPIYNADGNERMSTDSRTNQDGPEQGQGQRPNVQGLDLNRDYMKLESPEARAMVSFLNTWDPDLIIDTHTTNGSYHRYLLTYAPPLNPSGHRGPIEFVRDELLPRVSRRLLERTGMDSFTYGNFDAARERWSTYDSRPRFGSQYHGLRQHLSILSEAYSHAPYRERVEVTREFVRECLLFAAEHRAEIRALRIEARDDLASANGIGGRTGRCIRFQPHRFVGLRHELAEAPTGAVLRTWVQTTDADGAVRPTDEPLDLPVRLFDRFAPTHSVQRPFGYVLPADRMDVVDLLRAHGLPVARLGEACPQATGKPQEVELYRIDAVRRAEQSFEGHLNVAVDATLLPAVRALPADAWLVSLPDAGMLSTLAIYLLEPESDDGLVTWNAFDDDLVVGAEFPVLRLPLPL